MAARVKHHSKTPPEPVITHWSAPTGIGQSAWTALRVHYEKVRELHRRDLFAQDPQRGERMTAEAVGLFLDYSKNRITDETLAVPHLDPTHESVTAECLGKHTRMPLAEAAAGARVDAKPRLFPSGEADPMTYVAPHGTPPRDLVGSIRQAVETLSCRDYPDIRMTADFVGISVRTLQRRLGEAGVSHHMLVAQARFATAAAVLERTDAKILDLALDLGYSDHANFTRAFRRWAGCSPRDYRFRHARRRRVAKPFAARRGRGGPTA